ncbi:MAG: hypothetical protein LBU22_15620 [Dysgonamonadaceae bacterium]|jgi:hypothetical protein|nr:hypothetical protein [Dysgonamonadaceae bacterium]
MKHVSIIFLFCLLSVSVFSQTSTQGTDFWVAFGKPESPDTTRSMQIRIVASKTTVVKWIFTANPGLNFQDTIPAGGVHTKKLSMDEKKAVHTPHYGDTKNSLHLQTDEPVSVYAITQRATSTDATNILPVSDLGMDYYHISYVPDFDDGFVAVAIEDNTYIYQDGKQLGNVMLAGDVLGYYYGPTDKTGMHITSNKPIAYFVANDAVTVPTGINSADCLYQQMMPVHTWGTHFLVPVSEQGVTRTRVVASQDKTTFTQVRRDDQDKLVIDTLTLDAGKFAEWETLSKEKGCFISSDKPVGVVSFLVGIYHSLLEKKMGDPSMTWIPPVEQTIDSVSIAPFIPKGKSVLKEHHAMIITPTATRDQTTLSLGGSVPAALSGGKWTTSHADYSYYSLQLTDSIDSYLFANPKGLTVLGYGLGDAESYYYLAGAAARNLNANFFVNDIPYQEIEGREFCDTLSFRIRSEISYVMSAAPGFLTWWIDGDEQLQARDQREWVWDKNLIPGEHTITMEIVDASGKRFSFSTHIILCGSYSPNYKIPVNPQIKAGY